MLLALLLACGDHDAPAVGGEVAPAAPAAAAAPQPASDGLRGEVLENLAAGDYTYSRVKTASGTEIWSATAGAGPAVGATVTVATGLPMENFHSEALNRDFALVYFVEGYDGAPSAAPAMPSAPPMAAMPATEPSSTPDAGAPAASGPPAGKKSVADVWADRKGLNGREVTVHGKVVKATNGVLGHNWLHIQDGTGSGDNADLTLTTKDSAKVGDEITATGVVVTDKDFGAGYAYPVLVQGAKLN